MHRLINRLRKLETRKREDIPIRFVREEISYEEAVERYPGELIFHGDENDLSGEDKKLFESLKTCSGFRKEYYRIWVEFMHLSPEEMEAYLVSKGI
ncbi:hypothetical protein K8I28_11390 [bacterium]|nr:hypothetical protein [bacterium]